MNRRPLVFHASGGSAEKSTISHAEALGSLFGNFFQQLIESLLLQFSGLNIESGLQKVSEGSSTEKVGTDPEISQSGCSGSDSLQQGGRQLPRFLESKQGDKGDCQAGGYD